MVAGTVVMWRHGQTDYNLAGRLQGQVDIPLNATGRQQAEYAARFIARYRPSVIVASDLVRAATTARAAGALLELPVATDVRLRERNFGIWEGLHGEEVERRWPEQYARWRAGQQPEGVGAETRGSTGRRFAEAVEEHAEALEPEETLLVVAHGACIGAGITALLGEDPDVWAGIRGLENCHWSVVRSSERAPRWRVEGHNLSPLKE